MQKHEDLKAARSLAGLKQQQAAEIAGVSQKQYSFWETGKSTIPDVKYYAFLTAVGITQAEVDAYWKEKGPEERPQPVKAQADAYIFSLPYDKAQAYCADVISRHPELLKPKERVYDANGYDQDGYNAKGFDQDGFDREGYDKRGRDKDGYGKPEGVNKLRYDHLHYPYPFNYQTHDEAGEAASRKVWDAREVGDVYAKTTAKAEAAYNAAYNASVEKLIKLEGKDFVAREYARLVGWMNLNFETPEADAAYWAAIKAERIAKGEDRYILELQVKYKLPGFKAAQQRLDELDAELC